MVTKQGSRRLFFNNQQLTINKKCYNKPMAIKTTPTLIIKHLFIDFIGGFLYFPIWWYSRGLKMAAMFCFNQVRDMQDVLGVWIWVKNFFVPMYAQYDIVGRLISVFMRFWQILFRTIALVVWVVIMLAVFLIWVFGPLFVIYQLLNQIGGILF